MKFGDSIQASDTGVDMGSDGVVMETAAHLLRRGVGWCRLWDKRRHEQVLFRGSADPASRSLRKTGMWFLACELANKGTLCVS